MGQWQPDVSEKKYFKNRMHHIGNKDFKKTY